VLRLLDELDVRRVLRVKARDAQVDHLVFHLDERRAGADELRAAAAVGVPKERAEAHRLVLADLELVARPVDQRRCRRAGYVQEMSPSPVRKRRPAVRAEECIVMRVASRRVGRAGVDPVSLRGKHWRIRNRALVLIKRLGLRVEFAPLASQERRQLAILPLEPAGFRASRSRVVQLLRLMAPARVSLSRHYRLAVVARTGRDVSCSPCPTSASLRASSRLPAWLPTGSLTNASRVSSASRCTLCART